jgi:hypothetical protein
MKIRRLQVAVLAVALTVVGSARAQIVVGFTSVTTAGGGGYQTVTLNSTGSVVINNQTGVEAGVYNLDVGGTIVGGVQVGGVATPSFCIDIARDAPTTPNNTYSYAALTSAPEGPSGPMTGTQATILEQLWAAYGGTSGVNQNAGDGLALHGTVDLAALQVAIWEELGNNTIGYNLTVSDNSTVTSDASTYLNYVLNNTGTLAETPLLALKSGSTQNYLVPVPEPTTLIAGAMLLLPFGASTLRTLRRSRSA